MASKSKQCSKDGNLLTLSDSCLYMAQFTLLDQSNFGFICSFYVKYPKAITAIFCLLNFTTLLIMKIVLITMILDIFVTLTVTDTKTSAKKLNNKNKRSM